MPCVLTIAGSDSGGGAGIQADLKTFTALNVYGACVVTAVTSQNTRGVYEVLPVPLEMVRSQLDAVLRDLTVEFAKTGMLYAGEVMMVVADAIDEHGLRVVVDPVLRAGTGELLVREGAERVLIREVVPRAYVVTPNVFEAEEISGVYIRSVEDAEEAARRIADLGPRAVVVKGGHLGHGEVVDILYHDGEFRRFAKPRLDVSPHGAGCVFSSAITAYLAHGFSVEEAVEAAEGFIQEAVAYTVSVGGGRQPVNPAAHLMNEAEKYRVLEDVDRAVELFEGSPELHSYVAEVGTQIAMALPYASNPMHVAAVEGRVVRVRGRARAVGPVRFGASSHLARLILTAMKYDPSKRAAVNLHYDGELLEALRTLGVVASFDRRREPERVKATEGMTLQWGVEEAVRSAGTVPDVIYDLGDVGKEPMIRVLGASATDVVRRVLNAVRGASPPTQGRSSEWEAYGPTSFGY